MNSRGRQAPVSGNALRQRRHRERIARQLQCLAVPANLGAISDALYRHGRLIASPYDEDRAQLGNALGEWLPALLQLWDATYPHADVTRDGRRDPNRRKPE